MSKIYQIHRFRQPVSEWQRFVINKQIRITQKFFDLNPIEWFVITEIEMCHKIVIKIQ